MTFTAYLALQEELRLSTIQLKKAADEIEWLLLDGRAPDDPSVLALRAKMARLESSVAESESLLRRAVIVKGEDESIRVRIGSTVEVRNLATGAVMRYIVVSWSVPPKPSRGQARYLLHRPRPESVESPSAGGILARAGATVPRWHLAERLLTRIPC